MKGREAIAQAVFARVAALPGLVTAGRTLRSWSDVPPEEQPAAFLSSAGADADVVRGRPTRWTLRFEVTLYVHARTLETDDADPAMNALLDALEVAFAPDNGDGECTLSGLVSHCRVVGPITTDAGVLGEQSVAVVPLEVVPFP